MSFYGNVFYEFAELFRHFKFSNSGYDKTNLLTTKPADAEAKATERWDILNMDSGNRWIVLQGDNDGVDFYHAKSGTSDSEYATDLIQNFNANGANATGATTLSCGSTFTMPQLHFDSAGHFTSDAATTRKYQLPTAASIYNDGAPAYNGQKEATGLVVDSTATGATSLKEGDTIVTNTISLTDKGTVSAVT
jgi:hypothetical protein